MKFHALLLLSAPLSILTLSTSSLPTLFTRASLLARADSDTRTDVSSKNADKYQPSPPSKATLSHPSPATGGAEGPLRWKSCNSAQTVPLPGLEAEIDWACTRLSSAGWIPPYQTWIVRRKFKGRKLEWFVHNYTVLPVWLKVEREFCRREFRCLLERCEVKGGKEVRLGWTKAPEGFLLVHAVRFEVL